MNRTLVRNGLVAAAFMNIGGVLVFSRAFTNAAINNADPVVFSNFVHDVFCVGVFIAAQWLPSKQRNTMNLSYLGFLLFKRSATTNCMPAQRQASGCAKRLRNH